MEVDRRNASAQPLLGLSPLHVEAPQRPAGSRTGQRRGQWAGRGDARAHSGPGRGRSGGKTYRRRELARLMLEGFASGEKLVAAGSSEGE